MGYLFILKENIEKFYSHNDWWMMFLIKLLYAFISIMTIKSGFNTDSFYTSLIFIALVSVISGFLPWGLITFLIFFFTALLLYLSSFEIMAFGTVIIVMLGLFFIMLRPGNSYLIFLTFLTFKLHLPFFIPIVASLTLGFLSFIPITEGAFFYYFLEYVLNTVKSGSMDEISDVTEIYTELFKNFLSNRQMLIMLLAVTVCFVICFLVKSIPFDYSFEAAIFSAFFVSAIIYLYSMSRIKEDINAPAFIISMVLSLVFSYIFVLLFHNADYRGTERLEFEDDDYFYYVKAVPKIKSTDYFEDE